MVEQRFRQNSRLVSVTFDSSVDHSQCHFGIQIDHGIQGNAAKGMYSPTLYFELSHKQSGVKRFSISWYAEFIYNRQKNINEADLFGGLKFIATEIENFVLKNKEQFGQVSIPLEENPVLFAELHTVLRELYKNNQ